MLFTLRVCHGILNLKYVEKGAGWVIFGKAKSGTHFMSEILSAAEIKEELKRVPEWDHEKKQIERTFEFDDFTQAIDFINAVAEIAEEEEHHPDIDIRYNKVRLSVFTHNKNGLTELDFQLAERIDTLSEE